MTARSNDVRHRGHTDRHNRFDREHVAAGRFSADGEPSERAQVRELHQQPGGRHLKAGPSAARFIARREPLHPGAQRTLFDSELWRYRGFYTDADGRPRRARVRPQSTRYRQHARIENTIAALKDSGLKRMPFSDFDANARLDATRRAQHAAGEMVPTTAPARPTRGLKPPPNASDGNYGTH